MNAKRRLDEDVKPASSAAVEQLLKIAFRRRVRDAKGGQDGGCNIQAQQRNRETVANRIPVEIDAPCCSVCFGRAPHREAASTLLF
jgi:hypothetical protein